MRPDSVLLVLQQQNFKQKVVALLRRFKVSDEVSDPAWTARPTVSCETRALRHLGLVLGLPPTILWPSGHRVLVHESGQSPLGASRTKLKPPVCVWNHSPMNSPGGKLDVIWGCDHAFCVLCCF